MGDEGNNPWSETDDRGMTDEFVEHIDQQTALTDIQKYKSRSHKLLFPEEGDRILDVGCGVGDDVRALADTVGPTGEVVGVDNSKGMIAEARKRSTDDLPITFQADDALDLSFSTAAFDATRTDFVLQHLEDPTTAIEELVRVTRPGGRVGLSDMDWGTGVHDFPSADPEISAQVGDPKWKNPVHPSIGRELYRRAKEAGLTDLAVDPVVITITDPEVLVDQAKFDEILEKMRKEGLISASDADQWLSHLYEAGERGVLFSAITVFTVAGTKPKE